MSRIVKTIAAAAVFAGLFTAAAQAQTSTQFQGIIIVAASANPHQEEANTPRKETTAQRQFKRGKIVAFKTASAPGSIVVSTSENALYLVLGHGRAVKYRVATAKQGFEWSGTHKVSSKTQWPDWRPPAEMRQRRPDLPAFMAGGLDNPLGARAIYLGSSIYRIHGTNEPKSIGKPASSGCIRMLNEDVTELYRFVKLGATVTVI
ncbi:MAG: L,D-transpeptidase [Rhizobiales bacterium]|nr:L,D-transpeptidase [Hyphomicrobiales bacterium]